MRIETMNTHVGPRMKAFLERIAAELGYGEVLESVDDYGYCLFVSPTDNPDDAIDVTYELGDSVDYEGEDEPQGVAPGIMIVRYGGEILGQIQPHNYTAACWVLLSERSAQAEVEQRMDDIEDAYDSIIKCLQEA